MIARSRRPARLAVAAVVAAAAWSAQAEEPVDWDAVGRIRNEGFLHSQVRATLAHLTDRIGPRLTGSPAMREANEWTRDRLAEWGLERSQLERWGRFGQGWTFGRVSVHAVSPRLVPLIALPIAWTPGTEGPVIGSA
ncbi:MAG: peptidase, partial [Thermoanaerobaculia bacterium]|nr:peptidase [Thermoanaerobaculia bacterium]